MAGKRLSTGKREVSGSFRLLGGEDSYTSQDSGDPNNARRLLSFFPLLSGELTRELGQPKYLPTQLPAGVGAVIDYAFNNTSGVRQSVRFACTSTQVYLESGGAWVLQNIINPATGIAVASPLSDTPQFVIYNNLLHMADGTNNWIYDGPNARWIVDGIETPIDFPTADVTGAGAATATIGRYYWYTFADETAGTVHESSSSLISNVGYTFAAKNPVVSPYNADTIVTALGSKTVTVNAGSGFSAKVKVGWNLYVAGVNYGPIAQITGNLILQLANNAPATNAAALWLACPPRTTHIHIYGSEIDGSKLGKYYGHFAVTAATASFTDTTTFITDPASTISNVDRPIRNDPAPASRIVELHKYRIFRRREAKPNFFLFSGNEEITAGNGNGAPAESYPGGDGALTKSDLVDEASYPQEANRLRAIKSHADALWLATEKGIIPLYGNSIDDFGLLQVVTITGGTLSRWGMVSTPHGLTILGYDRLLRIYPPISPIYSLTPQNLNVTDQLIEIGRPVRNKLKTIKGTDQDNVKTFHYQFGERDWLVLCYQDTSSIYHTYVYDFQTKAWWESQRGFSCVGTFEPVAGQTVLVGGGTDGFVYVMDDVSNMYVTIDANGTANVACPAATYRTALIDFTRPDMMHVLGSVEFELSNANLANDITLNFYMDPQNADSPGTAFGPMTLSLIPGSAARYRAEFSATNGVTGSTCQRAMVEVLLAASVNTGSLRGILLKAEPVPELLR